MQTVLTGDGPEPVLKAWVALLGRVTARRERENFMFARALVEASQRNSIADAGVPVEQVLERVVAPWGKERVLLIVMDGMTHAVWRRARATLREGTRYLGAGLKTRRCHRLSPRYLP